MLLNDLSGMHFNYYVVCKRKLWYFSKGLGFENFDDNVKIGQLIDEESYKREKKQFIFGNISIDMIRSGVVCEVKKSDKIEKAHVLQLKFYLLKIYQILGKRLKGEILYPKMKKKVDVFLNDGDIDNLSKIAEEINHIINLEIPPDKIKSKICKKCSYFELCFI